MVGSLTLGKKKYAAVQEEAAALKERAGAVQAALLDLVQKDAEAFAPLAAAYRLPGDTEAQQAEKAQVMEAALKEAVAAPLEIMERCAEAIAVDEAIAAVGTAIAISDAGCAAAILRAALEAASLNVFVNTKAMKDRACAAALDAKAEALLAEWTTRAAKITGSVRERLRY
jgi:formiminotetrahydrofolate cyclodeaminase